MKYRIWTERQDPKKPFSMAYRYNLPFTWHFYDGTSVYVEAITFIGLLEGISTFLPNGRTGESGPSQRTSS